LTSAEHVAEDVIERLVERLDGLGNLAVGKDGDCNGVSGKAQRVFRADMYLHERLAFRRGFAATLDCGT
ncbi:MAG: hypothetical protein JO293_07410, partial [Candidatus Eremiobacteraeota bacterium]|nr:hypothetical protein [Candidatus Eremiobacteraeota bacterium]